MILITVYSDSIRIRDLWLMKVNCVYIFGINPFYR